MVASWELQSQVSVLCVTLHTDLTSIAWAYGLRNLQIPGQCIGLAGMPYDMARNVGCMRALEGGFSHVLHLDSDVVPPHDGVMRLLAHKKPIISGMYCRRSPPAGYPVAIKHGTWLTNFKMGSVVEVDFVGAGFLLIERKVLEQLKPQAPGKHWFRWAVDLKGIVPEGEALSEDFTFCKAAKDQLGISTLLDTSIHCKHVGLSQVTYGKMEPLDAAALT